MNKILLKIIAAAGLAFSLLAPAQATLLTFDDGPGGPMSTYHGFTWLNSDIVDASESITTPGLYQSAVSGTQVVIGHAFGANGFSSANAFSLSSGYFTAFDGSGVPLTVAAYLNGQFIGTQSFLITNQSPRLVMFDQVLFGNITSVTFNNFSGSMSTGNALAFDNLTVNTLDAGGDVPEPASIALLGLGLLGLACARRLRKA